MNAVANEDWVRAALALSDQAGAAGEVPVIEVLVYAAGGTSVQQGRNRTIGARDPTAHAEINALRDAAARCGNHRLVGATLYVTLEPCMMCSGALVHARIKRLVFGAWEPRTGAVESQGQALASPAHNHRVAVTGGVLQAQCRVLMQKFFQARRS